MIHVPEFNIPAEKWVEDKLLIGKNLASEIRTNLRGRVEKSNIKPGLAVLLAGDDPASTIYVSHKEKAAAEAGFNSIVEKAPTDITQKRIMEIIDAWNADPGIHGILVQLPLPSHIHEREVLQRILPEKDVDGFHFENIGRLSAKSEGIVSCTPLGIMVMIRELGFATAGKNAVVLGRSNIVGKPMAQLLLDVGQSTVTICHSKTAGMEDFVQRADILVSAMGMRGIVNPEWIKPGALVIDVGMHRGEKGICGDLDYKDMLERVSYITPVPRGVGPMTIAMLLYNTYHNANKQ